MFDLASALRDKLGLQNPMTLKKAPVQQAPLTLGDRIARAFPEQGPGLIKDRRPEWYAKTPMPAGIQQMQPARPKRATNRPTAPTPQPQRLNEEVYPMQPTVSLDGSQLQGSSARQKLYRPMNRGWGL